MKHLLRTAILALCLTFALPAWAAGNPGYAYQTSKETRAVTLNADFDAALLQRPVLVTSIGQSADASMLEALLKKVKADYTFLPLATPEEAGQYKTVIIAAGASSKGLGAAGISKEQELDRARALMDTVKEKGLTVILMHLGGATRRGALSDQFVDLVFEKTDYIVMVEAGNEDGKFTAYAAEKNIPLTLLAGIADALPVVKALFAVQ